MGQLELVGENNNPVCYASIVDGSLRLENYWSGNVEEMSLEIIYTIPSESFKALNIFLGYPEDIPITTLLKNINHDGKGAILWNCCKENQIPNVKRFTWLS